MPAGDDFARLSTSIPAMTALHASSAVLPPLSQLQVGALTSHSFAEAKALWVDRRMALASASLTFWPLLPHKKRRGGPRRRHIRLLAHEERFGSLQAVSCLLLRTHPPAIPCQPWQKGLDRNISGGPRWPPLLPAGSRAPLFTCIT